MNLIVVYSLDLLEIKLELLTQTIKRNVLWEILQDDVFPLFKEFNHLFYPELIFNRPLFNQALYQSRYFRSILVQELKNPKPSLLSNDNSMLLSNLPCLIQM